jgi:iron(II)-dependent oxidoreductase
MLSLAMRIPDATLAAWIADARVRTLSLVADLRDDQLMGPRLPIVNPLRWEIGHVAWFQELWALRTAHAEAPLRDDGDRLYDSSAIPNRVRWDLPLPSRAETIRYLEEVRDRVLAKLAARPATDSERYYLFLSLFHEDMHDEAFAYTRQTLEYPPPSSAGAPPASAKIGGPLPGDAEIPGCTVPFGSTNDSEEFIFDNEKYAHLREVKPFAMARAPVTQSEFAAFADDRGYGRDELWSDAGAAWRRAVDAHHPIYWRREAPGRWLRRAFDDWVTLEPHRPVLHVNWYEAEAYCRWAGRRLPTELEWEAAATMAGGKKRRYPWGDGAPAEHQAHLDMRGMGCADVADYPAGDNIFGVRQLIGNIWEWTADDFLPFPGFSPDPYKDYSEPWFGDHKVLRGGCWVTRSRLIRSAYRNFYKPDRRDVWAGFRTCAR